MRQNLIKEEQLAELDTVNFLIGDRKKLAQSNKIYALSPFDDRVLEFLDVLSKKLMKSAEAKAFPDIITLGFWMRKASMLRLKERFMQEDGNIHLGRGIVFHIAPSNVPVNYAYSLVAGLITGNINIVRVPSKEFLQISVINKAIEETLLEHGFMADYIYLVRYERNQKINDIFSSISNVRVVWGGDNTIAELRKSSLPPRSEEITFADRYSLAVIDAEHYLKLEMKDRFLEEFYNDTYLTDQNACTSPRGIIWIGNKKESAQKDFWGRLHALVKNKYAYQPIMGVNKLTNSYILAATHENVVIEPHEDNLLLRIKVNNPEADIMKYRDNSGYFFEFEVDDLLEIKEICDDLRCQTIAYLGEKSEIIPLLTSGIQGIDRVVHFGHTMDFDLNWDGYNLYERLTRVISVSI